MKAIMTKVLPATDTLCTRIKAWEPDGKSVIESWQDGMDGYTNACYVAYQLCDKLHWRGKLIGGWLKNGYVFVFNPEGGAV